MGVNIRANIFRMEKQSITISDECWLPRSILLISQRVYLRHNRDLARAKINGKFHLSFFGLTFKQNSRKIKCTLSLSLSLHTKAIFSFNSYIYLFICSLNLTQSFQFASKIEIIGHYRFSNFTSTDFVALLNPLKHRLNGLTLPTQSNGCKGQK